MSTPTIEEIPVYNKDQFEQLSPEEQNRHDMRLGQAAEKFYQDQRSSSSMQPFNSTHLGQH